MLDVAILVPFQGPEGFWLEPVARRSQGPTRLLALLGRERLSEALGADLRAARPRWAAGLRYTVRTLGAVALATSAKRAGLSFHAIDPGEIDLAEWRARLRSLAARSPRLVAVNTTFVNEPRWLHLFCAMVRREIPRAKLAIGGYFYATDAQAFLGVPADVYCVGEGETRLAEIALAIRDGRHLDDIPGLYLREPDGRLRSTGTAPALDLETAPLPDWSLAARMDPPVDPERDGLLFHVETQRGCVFHCEFCTFRTLSGLAETSPARAAEAVLHAARSGRGRTFLADATATFPKERWRRVLEAIESAGGSPHPLSAFARVSDLDEEACRLMDRVGVRHVFIGQESGDQAVLNAMKKGTRVDQVRPAIDRMARHGIKATFGFISGFPGEDAAAAARSREMMLHLNDGADEPTVLLVYLDVFAAQDLATIRARLDLGSEAHAFGYDGVPMRADEAADHSLRASLDLAERPGAPVTGFGLTPLAGDLVTAHAHAGDWRAGFRWLKAFDRGVAMFVRREREGTAIDRRELSAVLRRLAAELDHGARPRSVRTRARILALRALRTEWRRETSHGPGVLTRLLAAREMWKAFGEPAAGIAALRTAAAPPPAGAPVPEPVRAERAAQAADLVQVGLAQGRRRRSRGAAATAHG